VEDGVKTHPWLLAALLANGGKRKQVADELGVPLRQVLQWSNAEAPVPAHYLPELNRLAFALILFHEERLRKAMLVKPKIVDQVNFNEELDNLNLAHWVLFGRSLLHFLLAEPRGMR